MIRPNHFHTSFSALARSVSPEVDREIAMVLIAFELKLNPNPTGVRVNRWQTWLQQTYKKSTTYIRYKKNPVRVYNLQSEPGLEPSNRYVRQRPVYVKPEMGWKLWLQYPPPATVKAVGKAWNEWTQERPWRHRCHFHSRAQLIRWLFCWFPSPKSTQRQQQTNIKTRHPSAVPAQHGSRSQLQSTVGMYNDSIQRATSPAASACELGVLPSRLRCLSPVTLRLRPIAAGRAKCCLAGLTGGGCQSRCLKGGHNRHAGIV